MKRVKLTVAYDGTNYCGWQVQPNGITVQEVLNQCLSEFTGENIETIGASRTDAGVHALGNVAVFDTEMRMPGDKFSFALNQRLPEDIRIQKSEEVDANFHPRYVKSQKTYEYRILNCRFPIPTERFYSHFTYIPLDVDKMKEAASYLIGEHDFKSFCGTGAQVCRFPIPTERFYSHFTYIPLDVDKMKEAASYLIGEHDFKSFCGTGAQVKTTVRTVKEIQIEKSGDRITIRITGEGFLYNMVRIIAGTLMDIGGGLYPPEKMKEILEAKDRKKAGPTAPARGLTLMKIQYF